LNGAAEIRRAHQVLGKVFERDRRRRGPRPPRRHHDRQVVDEVARDLEAADPGPATNARGRPTRAPSPPLEGATWSSVRAAASVSIWCRACGARACPCAPSAVAVQGHDLADGACRQLRGLACGTASSSRSPSCAPAWRSSSAPRSTRACSRCDRRYMPPSLRCRNSRGCGGLAEVIRLLVQLPLRLRQQGSMSSPSGRMRKRPQQRGDIVDVAVDAGPHAGYWILMARRRPSRVSASCTWPIEAAASGVNEKRRKRSTTRHPRPA